jgi:hypothetical protein
MDRSHYNEYSKRSAIAGVHDEWTSKCEHNQRDAAPQVNLLPLVALHVSGDVFAHHQEHLTVFTASGNVYQCRYQVGVRDTSRPSN